MADDIAAAPAAGTDEQRLHELGYAQELRRRMSGFSNFAVSFTIISILSGCLTLYGYGMNTGGPAIIVWGWPIVGIMTLMVGLAINMYLRRHDLPPLPVHFIEGTHSLSSAAQINGFRRFLPELGDLDATKRPWW